MYHYVRNNEDYSYDCYCRRFSEFESQIDFLSSRVEIISPDDIERIFMSSDRNANQTWHYYRINRSFTFYDQNGFGDYRLTTPYITGRAW